MGRVSWSDLEVSMGATGAADVLVGFQTFAASTGATTVITVPAGRTWSGSVAVQCAVANAGANAVAAAAIGVVTTAGAGVVPAAGTVAQCDALAGANVAGGTVGNGGAGTVVVPLVVVAPAGNPVTIQAAATIAGTAGVVNVTCSGTLV